MRRSKPVTGLAMALVLGFPLLTACEVNKTDDGEMPEVEVKEGELPEYDVDTADVDVDSETKQVEVPDVDVDTETKEIEVPDVDIDMPDEEPAPTPTPIQ